MDRGCRCQDRLHRAGQPLGENGYIESFNAHLRDELLNGEIFYTLRKAQIVIESWRRHYNTIRPHASIGYRKPGATWLSNIRCKKARGVEQCRQIPQF
jgi:transposase InsO family protein